jgi:HAE1 family hydrophobic/amphiphilic exporter-1
MLENIVRHVEHGEKPLDAALRGSREIWSTITSMTISLAAVFIPILFMGGILGRLFREFAVTICTAILISGFVSVTLTPMLCSRLLTEHIAENMTWPSRMMEKGMRGLTRLYELSLGWVLRHRIVMVLLFFGMLGATGVMFNIVPKGFIPEVDADMIMCGTEMLQGTSFEQMKKYQIAINDIILRDPDVEGILSSVGGGGPMGGGGGSRGNIFVQLKPRRNRVASAQEIVARIRPRVSSVPGVRAFPSLPPAMRIGGRGSRSSYELTLQSPDTALLYAEGAKLEREVARLPSVLDVNSDIQMRSPRVRIDINRDAAANFGLTAQAIQSAIYNGYGPSIASTIYAPTNQFRVMLEVMPRYQDFADMISRLYLKTQDERLIPLDAVTRRVEDVGPQSIAHSGQLPSVTVSFNLKPGVALSQAVDEVSALANEKLPPEITPSFSGTAKVFQDSMQNLGLLLLVAILVVYIVLGMLYESFIHPLTILSGLPSAAFGALLTLYVFGLELNVYAFVGLILLVGLVKKNAIMQIDFALEGQRSRGLTPEQAIFEGCIARFRPIMMTTFAALFGAIPIASGYGSGGEARKPLGMAIVGGLIFSQSITLYLTPVVYTYLDRFVRRFSRGRGLAAPQPGALPTEARS